MSAELKCPNCYSSDTFRIGEPEYIIQDERRLTVLNMQCRSCNNEFEYTLENK